MKEKMYSIIAIILICNFVVSCASSVPDSDISKKDEIVIWTWDETFNVKAARMAAEEYEKEHKNIEVSVVMKEREEIIKNVKNMLAADIYNDIPDVVLVEDYDAKELLSLYADEFVDLTDRIDYTRYVNYKKDLCVWNERYYGIPFDSGTTALFYRIDILKEAGYDEKDMEDITWDQFVEIGRDVYEKTGKYMLTLDPTDFPIIRLIMQSAGRWYVTKDGARADIEDNEAVLRALQLYDVMLDENVGISVNGWNEFISGFQKGQVASVISGVWIMSSIREAADQSGLWRATRIPALKEGEKVASNLGGSSWYIIKNSKHPEEATQFMVKMFGDNIGFMDKLISEIAIIPPVNDPEVYTNYLKEDGYFGGQKIVKLLTQFTKEIPAVNYGSKTYEIEDILESEFQNALSDKDFVSCLRKVQIKADALVKE